MNEMIEQKLRAPFPSKDVEWRIQSVDKDKLRGLAVPYIDSRAVQNRLDEVFGIYGWQNTFSPWHTRKKGASGQIESQICGISVYDKNTGEWITKWDGAEDTNIEPIKGGLSDSFKRAAVQWGIGRYLYDMPSIFVQAVPYRDSFRIADHEKKRLMEAHEKFIKEKFALVAQSSDVQSPTKPPLRTDPPAYPYQVLQVSRQESSGAQRMVIELQQSGAKPILAYFQGWDDRLKPGAKLRNVQIKSLPGKKSKNTYSVLTEFELAA